MARPRARRGALMMAALAATWGWGAVRVARAADADVSGGVRERQGAHALPPRVAASLGAEMGLARSPFPSPLRPETSGLLTTFRLEARVSVSATLAVELRAPLVVAGVDLPAGGVRPDTAWGHPELAIVQRALTRASGSIEARLGASFPLGTDDAAFGGRPFANQALTLASAQVGWRDRELFAPGRLAVTPGLSARMERSAVDGFVVLKTPLLWAVKRDQAAQEPAVQVKALAASVVLGAGVARSFGRVGASLGPWLVWDVVPMAQLRGAPPARAALTLVPALTVRLTERVVLAADATIFLAGALHAFPSLGLAFAGTS